MDEPEFTGLTTKGQTVKVYIAGPMRGKPGYNIEAFEQAEFNWKLHGHQVFSPAALIRAMPYGVQPDDPSSFDRQQAIHIAQMDIGCLYHCDAIALLPEWENSIGSTMELAVAQFLGLKIFCAETMQELSPDYRPWGEIMEYQRIWEPKKLGDC
jgi:hypothetical protein